MYIRVMTVQLYFYMAFSECFGDFLQKRGNKYIDTKIKMCLYFVSFCTNCIISRVLWCKRSRETSILRNYAGH